MKVQTGAAMIMGCNSRVANNGNTYYNVDVYDSIDGGLFTCTTTQDIFNNVLNTQKPFQVKSLTLNVMNQYQGTSRLEILGWS